MNFLLGLIIGAAIGWFFSTRSHTIRSHNQEMQDMIALSNRIDKLKDQLLIKSDMRPQEMMPEVEWTKRELIEAARNLSRDEFFLKLMADMYINEPPMSNAWLVDQLIHLIDNGAKEYRKEREEMQALMNDRFKSGNMTEIEYSLANLQGYFDNPFLSWAEERYKRRLDE